MRLYQKFQQQLHAVPRFSEHGHALAICCALIEVFVLQHLLSKTKMLSTAPSKVTIWALHFLHAGVWTRPVRASATADCY